MKDKVLSILFLLIIFSLMLLSIALPDKDISVSERRKLSSFPSLNLETIINGEFFENLNDYLVEQFPFRDLFRSIKGIISNHVFQKIDEDGVFVKNKNIYQLNANLDLKSISHFTELINKINEKYLSNNNVYYSIIPDKNYYLQDNSIPKLDYEQLEYTLNHDLKELTYINIFDTLNLDSYYKTDIHWRQEKLNNVIQKLEKSMNLSQTKLSYTSKEYSKFYGALYGRLANNLLPDKLEYLTNDHIENAIVYDYDKNEYRKVYEEEDLNNIDSYDIYLGGAKSLLIIENKNQDNGKELIMFRDSFGSSIAPLLIENYSKITMIDLRYLNSSLLGNIEQIDFSNESQDILFLYSVPVINSSFTLK